MKILLSAFACEPGVGSEPGIGWRWAIEIANMGHSVTVITQGSNREKVNSALESNTHHNLEFVFYDLPKPMRWAFWYRLWPYKMGHRVYWYVWEHIYHLFWQYGAYRKSKRLHQADPFDLVHHITYGVGRRASFMGNLGARFIVGPIGGGERAPYRLRQGLNWQGKLADMFRDFAIVFARLNPLLWLMYAQAEHIYLKTSETLAIVPRKQRYKTSVSLEIGIESPERKVASLQKPSGTGVVEILYVGRFLYWKGMAYGIRAFERFAREYPDARLTLIGQGPEEKRWRELAARIGVEGKIEWVQWVNQNDLQSYYHRSDLLLFPSLHDSSGNVVLEALAHGIPVICLELGGPFTIVNDKCAVTCPVKGKHPGEVVSELTQALGELAGDSDRMESLRAGALERARQLTWAASVRNIYNTI